MNTVLIQTDQLAAKWLECGAADTPNLHRLAREGMRFTRCIAHNPVCMPSRASMLTGRSSRHHGVLLNGYELGHDLPTFAQVLQRNGVRTVGFGKFHLQCHLRSAHNDVRPYGFDEARVTEDIRAGDWLDWVRAERPEAYERALATVWPTPHLREYGPERENLLPKVLDAARRHPPRRAAKLAWPCIVPEEATQTRWIGDLACQEIGKAHAPFFLYVSFVAPHDPYDPPSRFLDRVDGSRIPEPVPAAWQNDPLAPALFRNSAGLEPLVGLCADEWRTMRHYYLASLAFIDDQVGRIVQAIEERGLRDTTRVLFTSDHGDLLGDHGLPYKGAWHYDACVRVPLIAWGPGIRSGVCDAPVETMDLYPTVLDLAGAKDSPATEGRSLMPWMRGERPARWRSEAYSESYATYDNVEQRNWARTVRTSDYRYTLYAAGGGEMLFDLRADPDEQRNLAGDPAYASVRHELRGRLLERIIGQDEPLPTRNLFQMAGH
jgi:choline-sulfatase